MDIHARHKIEFKSRAINWLYEKQEDLIKQSQVKLVMKNNMLTGKEMHGFLYEGRAFYGVANPSSWKVKNNLQPSLFEDAKLLLREIQYVADEKLRVEALLGRILYASRSTADLYELLPVQMHEVIGDYFGNRGDEKGLKVLDRDSYRIIKKENDYMYELLGERLMTRMLIR